MHQAFFFFYVLYILSLNFFNNPLEWLYHNSHLKDQELLQSKKLLQSKGNHQQNEKTTYEMGENIWKQCA